MASPMRAVTEVAPWPIDEQRLVDRLAMTLVSAVWFAMFVPAIVLFVLSVLLVPLGVVGVGFVLAHVVVPLTEVMARAHRSISGLVLGEVIPQAYTPTVQGFLRPPLVWLRDPHRWRDVGFLAFSASGGAAMSGLPVVLFLAPPVHVILAFALGGTDAVILLLSGLLCVPLWWVLTPPLVRSRAVAERSMLGYTVADLESRVEQVEETRADTLDTSAAEIRRIERDLHDGAQARMAAVGMNVGLAEKLLATDPEGAAQLLREARESTVGALEDLRSVIRGIHPPALADRGLAGAIEALAVPIPLPVTVAVDVPTLPEPVQTAAYFAVAECLANTTKHAEATRAWVHGSHDGVALRIVAGDDGRGGADATSSGLAGVARRLAAFDGTMVVDSPDGGPTVVTMEIPCPTD